jgi:hypothetical protein
MDRTIYRYREWMERSIRRELPTKLTFPRKLGTRYEFVSLADYCSAEEINLYLDVDCVRLYGSSAGFTSLFNASRSLGKDPAEQYRYQPSTYYRDTEEPSWYLLEPESAKRVAERVLRWFGTLPGTLGLSFSSVPNTLYSDFAHHGSARNDSLEIWHELLRTTEAKAGPLFASGAHAYALPFVGHVVDVPVRSSRFRIADASVPFYQLVVNGSISYAGRPVNLSDEPEMETLYALETGGALHFSLTYGPSEETIGSSFDHLYSTNHEVWLPEMRRYYQTVDDVYRRVEGSRMIAHDRPLPDVTVSTYANGVRVIVNYSVDTVEVYGVDVGPHGYEVLEGGINDPQER